MLDLAPPTINELEQAVRLIQGEIVAGGRIFTHCALGVSRSACVAAAYLIMDGGVSVDDAIERVRAARRGVIFDAHTTGRLKDFAAAHRAAELIADHELGTRGAIATGETRNDDQSDRSASNAPSRGGAL
jgi:hypothetical protein